MCTEISQIARERASNFCNMNESQSPSSLDFVPKSDYIEKWHEENKCLLQNQQFHEGDKCGTAESPTESPLTCVYCQSSKDKFKSKIDASTFVKKSGDWKCCGPAKKLSAESIVQETVPTSEWKWKNPYSHSDFDKPRRWPRNRVLSGDTYSANLLRDLRTIDSRYKDPFKDDTEKNFSYHFRDYLMNYHELYGVPKVEYTFAALISTMGRVTGRSLLALLYVMLNIIPVVEVFIHLLRFIVDKVINIRNSKDFRQTMFRCFVFTTELFSLYVCLIFIFGFIVLPIVYMVTDIAAKIMLYN